GLMRPITRRSTLALPVEGWAWGLAPVGTRSSATNRQSNPWSFENLFWIMSAPPYRSSCRESLDGPDGVVVLRKLLPTNRNEPWSPVAPRARTVGVGKSRARTYSSKAVAVKDNLWNCSGSEVRALHTGC